MDGGTGTAHSHTVHSHSAGAGAWETGLPAAALLLLGAGYLLLARRARHRNPAQGWASWHTVCFLTGVGLLLVAVAPPLAPLAHHDFRGHMAQHLLIGMCAPLALVLGAPVTLLLRTLPADRARRLTAVLRSRPVGVVVNPVVALLLSTGSLAFLYFTPLYDLVSGDPALHWALHAHFLFSGALFAHVIAGPDPAPGRPSVPARLVVLGVAIAAHATLSQLMYGGFLIDVHAPVLEVRGGAEIMYYGGDIVELLMAVALITTWRAPARTVRRSGPPGRGARVPARVKAVEGS